MHVWIQIDLSNASHLMIDLLLVIIGYQVMSIITARTAIAPDPKLKTVLPRNVPRRQI